MFRQFVCIYIARVSLNVNYNQILDVWIKQFILLNQLLFVGGKGPISFSLVSDYGPPPCAPEQPFPPMPKDKLEPPTPSVYVSICYFC